jgi:ATP-dependent DNA ligase
MDRAHPEMLAIAASGTSLMRRPPRTVTLCVFDVLWLNGIDCTQLPYRDRRRVLEMLELSGPAWCMRHAAVLTLRQASVRTPGV